MHTPAQQSEYGNSEWITGFGSTEGAGIDPGRAEVEEELSREVVHRARAVACGACGELGASGYPGGGDLPGRISLRAQGVDGIGLEIAPDG
jgi:hypothetical protein